MENETVSFNDAEKKTVKKKHQEYLLTMTIIKNFFSATFNSILKNT